jgi:hypothetical protein
MSSLHKTNDHKKKEERLLLTREAEADRKTKKNIQAGLRASKFPHKDPISKQKMGECFHVQSGKKREVKSGSVNMCCKNDHVISPRCSTSQE